MASVNKVVLIGNLGKDPVIRYTASGTAVANFSLATTDKWTNKNGEKETRTEWHTIVAWDKLAEICGKYLTKGKSVYIEGRIQTKEWEDKEGNKRQTKEIVATAMQMLGAKGGDAVQSETNNPDADDSPGGTPTPGELEGYLVGLSASVFGTTTPGGFGDDIPF